MWPLIVAGAAAATASGAVPDAVSERLGLDKLTKVVAAALTPNVWKRMLVIALGLLLIYWGVLVWIASSDNVRGAVAGLVTGAATKNPAAAAGAAQAAQGGAQ